MSDPIPPSPGAHDEDYYKQAADDAWHDRDSPAFRSVTEEIRTMIRAGKTGKEIRGVLVLKGVPVGSLARVTERAEREEWQRIMTEAAADLADGKATSPNLDAARRLALVLVDEDPRPSSLRERLTGKGCAPALVDYLTSDPQIQKEQKRTGTFLIPVGLVALVLGWFLLRQPWTRGQLAPAGIVILVGAIVLGRGVLALIKR